MAAAAKPTGEDSRASAARTTTAKAATSRRTAAANDDLHDLQALLARHNKKFKTAHTYQPPQHSVRDVRAVRHSRVH